MIPTQAFAQTTRSANQLMFQNPEGWGCDSHTWEIRGSQFPLHCFRIPKDGGVIPTLQKEPPSKEREELFQNPEGWGCDSHCSSMVFLRSFVNFFGQLHDISVCLFYHNLLFLSKRASHTAIRLRRCALFVAIQRVLPLVGMKHDPRSQRASLFPCRVVLFLSSRSERPSALAPAAASKGSGHAQNLSKKRASPQGGGFVAMRASLCSHHDAGSVV